MKKATTLFLSSILTATLSTLAIAETVVTAVDIDQRLYPSSNTIFSTTVDLDQPQQISAIGLLTDWWQKRPTEVRVYENNNGVKGKLLGSEQFLTYDNGVCGSNYNAKCNASTNNIGRLFVPAAATVSSIIVEAHGLLSIPNGYAWVKGVQLLSGTTSASNASDSILAAIAVLENKEVQSITGRAAFLNSLDVGVSNDFSNYVFKLNYQIIDSPVKKCIQATVDYSDYPTGETKVAELAGDC
ncbi:hypothetical protein [Zooshikella ganghwensis]|uniref:Uncharacterized protein n=1 Tax=Zooshikella ganghwensis TaxID=202772 RepID=A0A4P9VGC7_9GAMM|nr:hypothetical protein [Zooshikella ganghwensis]RDH41399.1 hypothetical protein B9G39_28490 [Zooshikella ganghwensis]